MQFRIQNVPNTQKKINKNVYIFALMPTIHRFQICKHFEIEKKIQEIYAYDKKKTKSQTFLICIRLEKKTVFFVCLFLPLICY